MIGLSTPGERLKLSVWRDGSRRELEAKLGTVRTQQEELAESGTGNRESAQLGLTLRPLSAQERREAKVGEGLVVEDVEGAAARSGVEVGDVILSVNWKPIQSVDQLRSIIASKPKILALLVQREGQRIFIPVRLG